MKLLRGRLGKKCDSKHLRARLESCVETIFLLRQEVDEKDIGQEVLDQFERLRQTLPHITEGSVNEKDICRIEEITNEVLRGMRHILSRRALTTMHEGKTH